MSLIPSAIFSFLSLNRPKNTRNSDHPGRRWGHSAIVYNNKMIIFGGRYNQRSLANIFSLNLQFLTWTKLDSYGQSPPARDSHSVILYKNEMLIFGGSGSGKKLNDTWSFNFDHKKWTKIIYNSVPNGCVHGASPGVSTTPSPREGHCVALVNNYYMMVYGGLDENEKDINTIHLFDLRNNIWILAKSVGEEPKLRDSQSCTMINNTGYIFGGQGENDERFNDMYQLNFDIDETKQKYEVKWSQEITKGIKPSVRTSHSSVGYKNQFIFIIGGEGENQVPLNDVWIYDIISKEYSQLTINNSNGFEGRFCHSSCLLNDTIVIYGGMKNAEETLDNLSVLCLDDKIKGRSEMNTGVSNEDVEMKCEEIKHDDIQNNHSNEGNNNLLMKAVITNKILFKEIKTDTDDLNEENNFNFNDIKQNSIDNLISFSFLKKMSSIYQWPFLALSHLIINLFEDKGNRIKAKNLYIDKKIISQKQKQLIIIKDDGGGISKDNFIKMFSCYNKNQNKAYTFFDNGLSLKLSLLRLSNEVLIISKTNSTICVTMISNHLQFTIDTDNLVTPIVVLEKEKRENKKFNIINQYGIQSLNLILHELFYLFEKKEDFFNYLTSFPTGTHFLLSDMKRMTKEIYELDFDFTDNDIYYIEKTNTLHNSFKIYINYLFKQPPPKLHVSIFGNKLQFINPLHEMYVFENKTKGRKESTLFLTSLNCEEDEKKYNCILIHGGEYNGILYNKNYQEIEDNLSQGVHIYFHNILICKLDQQKLGFNKKEKYNKNIINGYIELPSKSTIYSVLHNKAEIKDQASYAFFYYKVQKLFNKLTI